ncbi:MAG: MFS transporter [Deltaproteobacteria bacterium]|nr:MFS transporter [Deltaproteobacteria bacterium]
MTTPSSAQKPPSALRLPAFRAFVAFNMMTMMADNVEHVISYWVCYQQFHSAALAGFAVVSHWLPYLLFSVTVGALNDRFDSRRIIQLGMGLFICASAGWGYFFITGTLTKAAAMSLLVLHGCAGVLWIPSSQVLLYSIVGPQNLQSAVRLNATARYLGVLVGPAVGSGIMYLFGPAHGIFLNTLIYLPLTIWLVRAPKPTEDGKPKRAVRGLEDIVRTIKDVRALPVVATMTLLAGCASFFVGNSYQAQMPGFAHDLGRAKADVTYSMLLAADAAGALIAGLLLETRGTLLAVEPRSALKLAAGWGLALVGFACVRSYPLALVCLFTAGFFELSFSTMAQTLVQMGAPDAIRGRVLGLYSMSAFGLRMFSGVCVGLVGSVTSIHWSLAGAAGVFGVGVMILWSQLRPPSIDAHSEAR